MTELRVYVTANKGKVIRWGPHRGPRAHTAAHLDDSCGPSSPCPVRPRRDFYARKQGAGILGGGGRHQTGQSVDYCREFSRPRNVWIIRPASFKIITRWGGRRLGRPASVSLQFPLSSHTISISTQKVMLHGSAPLAPPRAAILR